MQRRTTVAIEPADANPARAGHQVSLAGLDEIRIKVTSADRSRTRVYRVQLGDGVPAGCLRGAVAVGFSLVVYEGGSLDELAACAGERGVVALYALHEDRYVLYVPGAPEFVNGPFGELFAEGVPALTPLVVASEGPASPDPGASAAAPALPECLRGTAAEGFSLVLYEGGSVEDLAACARGLDVTALYVLSDGAWVSYVPGAPALANRPFEELFAGGVPALTPLIVNREVPAPVTETEPQPGTETPPEADSQPESRLAAGNGRLAARNGHAAASGAGHREHRWQRRLPSRRLRRRGAPRALRLGRWDRRSRRSGRAAGAAMAGSWCGRRASPPGCAQEYVARVRPHAAACRPAGRSRDREHRRQTASHAAASAPLAPSSRGSGGVDGQAVGVLADGLGTCAGWRWVEAAGGGPHLVGERPVPRATVRPVARRKNEKLTDKTGKFRCDLMDCRY